MMSPNERWDDFAIDKEFQRIDREFDRIGDVLKVTAVLPNQIAKLTGAVENSMKEHGRRLDSHHKWIEAIDTRNESRYNEVKALCERIGDELRNDARERVRNRISLVIAIISAAAIVAAAIITAPH